MGSPSSAMDNTAPSLPPMELNVPGEGSYVLNSAVLPLCKIRSPCKTPPHANGLPNVRTGSGIAVPVGDGFPVTLPMEPAGSAPASPVQMTLVSMNIISKSGAASLAKGIFKLPPVFGSSASKSPPSNNALGLEVPDDLSHTTDQALMDGGNQLQKNRKCGYPRPVHNIRRYTSGFIRHTQTHDALAKLVVNPPRSEFLNPGRVPSTRWAFLNVGRTLIWNLLDITGTIHEPLLRVVFAESPTCHTYCEATRSSPGSADGGRLGLMVGFDTGDILWFDPSSLKFSRLNKDGIISSRPVTAIRFHPLDPTTIYVLFANGTVMAFSTERDDPDWKRPLGVPPWEEALRLWEREKRTRSCGRKTSCGGNVMDEMFIWRNEEPLRAKGQSGTPYAGRNPVAVWKLGEQALKGLEFAPDGQMLATVSEDGRLRVVDTATARLLDSYASYFGALTCVAWSPDGRYIVTGGEDDLLTVISHQERRVVARCEGHSNYVTSISFEDRRRSNARSYRFASAGEDGRVCIWDFGPAEVTRPRHVPFPPTPSTSSTSVSWVRVYGSDEKDSRATFHPAPNLGDVPMIQPVMNKIVESVAVNQITLLADSIVTVSKMGDVRVWMKDTAKCDGMALGMERIRMASRV